LLELAGSGRKMRRSTPRCQARRPPRLELQPSPVEREARRLGIPVLKPASLKGGRAGRVRRAPPMRRRGRVRLILPKPILSAPQHGCFNLHASQLPRWRGAAPINRAIMAGDAETGVTVMKWMKARHWSMALIEPYRSELR